MRTVFLAAAAAAALLAVGYVLQQPWALATWPWGDGRLSNIFVGSILAAIAVPLGWIGVSGRLAAATGGFLHLAVMLGGAASVWWSLAPQGPVRTYAVGAAAAALACLAMAAWAHRQPARDTRPLPTSMRAWFVVYILILIPAGIALLRGAAGIMPWPLKAETSALYGWIFLSAVCSFAYPLLRPRLEYAFVGLWGFLAYDLVLLPPFLRHFGTVGSDFATTLWVYTAVLLLTAAISVWYLFIARATRLLR
jgi:hypothetical protein